MGGDLLTTSAREIMSKENKSEGLIKEIKASENEASKLVEEARKISAARLKSIKKNYEEKLSDIEVRSKQNRKATIQKALKHASEQEEQRKKEIDETIHVLENSVRKKRQQAIELIIERILG